MNHPFGKTAAPLSPEDLSQIRSFRRSLITLALPVMLQSLINAAVNYADVWMLARISQSAMSAASQAGQIAFVLNLLYLGLTTGVTILSSQYWGCRDRRTTEKILALALRLSMAVSLVFFLLTQLIPQVLMKLYTPDPELIAFGVPYLRTVGFSFPVTGFSQMALASMKSMEKTKESALISSAGLISNILLNAAAIFWLFPGDPLAALGGVALATVTARILEAVLCLRWLRRKDGLHPKKTDLIHTQAWLKRDFFRCTWQVQLNYLIWGGALSAITSLVGYVSSDMVSAYTVAGSLKNLAIVACTGVSTAGGILLGGYLGAGRTALAKAAGDRLAIWSLILGAFSGGILLLLMPLCLKTVDVNGDTARLLEQMLLISSVYCIGKSFNSTMVGGIFCAGGDTRFGLICDTIAMWGVVLPLGWLCAFSWQLPPLGIYLVLSLDEFIKIPFVAAHYRKYRWLNNLTHTEKE